MPQTKFINQQTNQPKKPTYRENQTTTKTTPPTKNPISETHQWLSTQQAREAHTEKNENLGHLSSPQRDNTVPLLLFLCNNRRAWLPQQSPPQPPPLEPPLSQQLPQRQPQQQPQRQPQWQHLHPLPLELTNTLETLWQPPSEGPALGLHLGAAAEEEEEEEGGEEAVAEGNQPLSLLSSSSLFPQQPTYATWEPSHESSKEKETRQTPS
jgi:hypothetical protein